MTSSRRDPVLVALLAAALAARAAAAIRFPILFDEVDVVAFGLARAIEVPGSVDRLAFDTPLAVSNGITPLWFWLQAAPAALFGPLTRAGLRIVPVLLGLAGAALAYQAGRRVGGPAVALLSGLAYAAGDVFVYTNARGEFTESLLAPLVLALFLDLLPGADREEVPLRSALWPALALFTYLGKGLVLLGAYALVLAALWLLGRRGLAAPRVGAGRLGACLALAMAPTALYLAVAQAVLFGGGAALATDLGPVRSAWENAYRLTAGYGTAATAFMAGRWHDALYVYRDARAWPTLALLAVPCAVALARRARDLVSGISARDPKATGPALVALGLALPPLAVLLARGALDARFHLLYLPVLLPHAAAVLQRWHALLGAGRRGRFVLLGLAGLLPAALTFARPPRPGIGGEGVPAFLAAVAVSIVLVAWRGGAANAERRARILTATVLAAALLVAGPLHWGTHWAWEPGPIASDQPREAATFAAPELQLAERALARGEGHVAAPALSSYLRRHPGDAQARALFERAVARPR